MQRLLYKAAPIMKITRKASPEQFLMSALLIGKRMLISVLGSALLIVPAICGTTTGGQSDVLSAPDLGGAKRIDAFVEHVMARWAVPGMAVAIISDGKIVVSKGYGVLESDGTQRVNADSVFQIGSMSKSFSATAAAMLVDDGKLAWDRPAVDYLPALHYADPWLTSHVTVRDLASNRVGIDDDLAWLLRDEDEAALLHAIAFIQSDAPFRTFRYSNTGFTTLGMVTERASAMTWSELIRTRVLQPLGMTRSGTGAEEFVQSEYLARCWTCFPEKSIVGRAALIPGKTNIAAPHGIKTGPATPPGARGLAVVLNWHYVSAISAAGAITSSANDMARYLQFHLNRGVLDGRRILSEVQARNLHTRQVLIDGAETASASDEEAGVPGYALGWEKRIYHGFDVSMHSGGQVGFASTMWLAPERQFAVLVMQNLDFQAAPACSVVAQHIVDYYLAVAPIDRNERAERDWARQPHRVSAPPRNTVHVDPTPLLGQFKNDVVGTVDVGFSEDLHTREKSPILYFGENSRAWLRPISGGDYLATFEGTETNPIEVRVRFNVGADGRAAGFRLGEEGDSTLRHVFHREGNDSH